MFSCVQINLHIQSERKALGKKNWDGRGILIGREWKKGSDWSIGNLEWFIARTNPN